MDLVRQLRDVRFDMAVRGYDCAGVDTFLATLRNDVSDLQAKHAEALEQIAELEANGVSVSGESSETEGTLRRTLLLAQRLADETEAEAKAEADMTVTAARDEAETMLRNAEQEAASKRQESENELASAQDEAAGIREAVSTEATQTRLEARTAAETLLAAAEETGSARVQEIEALAQDEVAAMREPVREEVEQLETVRSQLLVDIAELEAHLEAQRVRVRNAVEALRVGMSGSIEDLERAAEDDTLMAPEPTPEHSGVAAADVSVAPTIEIGEAVAAEASQTTPDVDDLQAAADAAAAESIATEDPAPAPAHAHEEALDSITGPDTEPIPVVDVDPDQTAVYDVAAEFEDEDVAIVEAEAVDPENVDPETAAPEAMEAEFVDQETMAPETVVAETVDPETVVAETVEPEAMEPEAVETEFVDAEAVGPEAMEIDPPEPEVITPVAVVSEVADDTGPTEAGMFAALGGAAVAAGAGVVGAEVIGGEEQGAEDAIATAADLEEADLVLLEDEENPLFGTDLGADATVEDASDAAASPEPASVGSGVETFIGRFAQSLDELPIEPH